MVRKSKSKSKDKGTKPINLRFPPTNIRFPIGSIVKGTGETATSAGEGRIVDTVMKLESLGSILYYQVVYDDGVEAAMTHEQLMSLVAVEGGEGRQPKSPNENVNHNDGKQSPESPNENVNHNDGEQPRKTPKDGPIPSISKSRNPKVDDGSGDDDLPIPPKSKTRNPKVVDDGSDDDGPIRSNGKNGKRKVVDQSDGEEEWDRQSGGCDDFPVMQTKRSPVGKATSTAKKPKTAAVSSSSKKKGVQVTLFGNKAPQAPEAAPKRDRKPKLKSDDDGEPCAAGDYNKKPYSAGDGLPAISEPQLMFDDMVQEQLSKNAQATHLLKSLVEKMQGRPLRVATMCSGTESRKSSLPLS
eukprot:scaffold4223_cov189-Amphora_coffeaeformis.AAC.56